MSAMQRMAANNDRRSAFQRTQLIIMGVSALSLYTPPRSTHSYYGRSIHWGYLVLCISQRAFLCMASKTEYDFVDPPSEEYFCPVTFELLKDPRQTNSCCGHHLSRAAAEQLEAEGKPCPLCKKWPLKTTEDLFFKR